MSSTVCGKCNLVWHVNRDTENGFCGQIWTEELGYHVWEPPTKEQIAGRLRKKYNVAL